MLASLLLMPLVSLVTQKTCPKGTEEMFSQEFSDAPILYSNMHENLGCAESTSRGIAQAVRLGYKYIWIMDDDVIPEPDSLYYNVGLLREILEYAEKNENFKKE